MINPTERAITNLRPGESVIDYIYPTQYELLEKYFVDPLRLIDQVDEILHKRKFVEPIKYPFKYILAVASRSKWPVKQ